MNPMFWTDGYKLDHRRQYPKGTEFVYSNWTARGSRIPGVDKVVFFGLQAALSELNQAFVKHFFARDVNEVCNEYQEMLNTYLGPNQIGTEHVRALHDLGYLPLEFKALPEGTEVPIRVPMFTVENTHPDFFWLTNYVETILSALMWVPCTSATLALRLRRILDRWADKTGDPAGVGFQGHDFSMRGMGGLESAVLSGMGHLVAFTGTETVPVLQHLPKVYPIGPDTLLAGTVPATEHSVMCAGGQDDERSTYERLLGLYPGGILSVVSDTWDFWGVLTNILPEIKDQIMARDGKLVIRPDSGDPADIICGTDRTYDSFRMPGDSDGWTAEEMGAIEILWKIFGGTVNEKGYKELDSHIGLIYGDSMTAERIEDICARLEAKGFASTNVVFGIGSFNYQYQTRDTFGFAMKATNVVIDGVETPIFKDPKTDNGTKKSLKGRIVVARHGDTGEIVAEDNIEPWQWKDLQDNPDNLLTTVWKDGRFVKTWTFDEVRNNALGR